MIARIVLIISILISKSAPAEKELGPMEEEMVPIVE